MSSLLRSLALVGVFSLSAIAAPKSFDFKDPKGVNAVQFTLDSLLEPINGTAGGVEGKVSFDAANVASTAGKITVASKSLKVPNDKMTEHLLGDGWLDTAKHAEITFEFAKLEDVKPAGDNKWSATAKGKFTLKGVSKDVSVPVTLSYLPGQFGKRINKPEVGGDLLVVRGTFSVTRADFGIKPGEYEDKVAPAIQLSFGLVGGAQ